MPCLLKLYLSEQIKCIEILKIDMDPQRKANGVKKIQLKPFSALEAAILVIVGSLETPT